MAEYILKKAERKKKKKNEKEKKKEHISNGWLPTSRACWLQSKPSLSKDEWQHWWQVAAFLLQPLPSWRCSISTAIASLGVRLHHPSQSLAPLLPIPMLSSTTPAHLPCYLLLLLPGLPHNSLGALCCQHTLHQAFVMLKWLITMLL